MATSIIAAQLFVGRFKYKFILTSFS